MTPGERLGPYEIVSALGAGGMGEVLVARDERLERLVALKVLPTTADEDGRRRLLTEARAAAALCHPNVATVYDVGEIGPTSFIAMELVAGGTLADRINATPLMPAEIAAIGIAIADALQAAHDKAVVHRDIKPANVMITASGQVKVLDFGLAKVATPPGTGDAGRGLLTQPGIVMGTVAYMSATPTPDQPSARARALLGLAHMHYFTSRIALRKPLRASPKRYHWPSRAATPGPFHSRCSWQGSPRSSKGTSSARRSSPLGPGPRLTSTVILCCTAGRC